MLASWLRMPGWLIGRNSIRSCLLPLAAVAVPLASIALILPGARRAQLDKRSPRYPYCGVSLAETVDQFESETKRGQATADAYFRLSAALEPETDGAQTETNGQVIEDLIELSKRPLCRFPELVLAHGSLLHRQIGQLYNLLLTDAKRLQADGELDTALDRYLTLLRIKSHALKGQPTCWIDLELWRAWYGEPIEKVLVEQWGAHPKQTSERLRAAISKLESCPATVAAPWDTILDVREDIRDILLDSGPPSFLSEDHPRWSKYLPFLANRLPWERQRALVALDLKISQTLNYLTAVMHCLRKASPDYATELRQLVRHAPLHGAPKPKQVSYYQFASYNGIHTAESLFHASTSYLVTQELNVRLDFRKFLRSYVDTEIRRRGLKLQLALLAYRLDHDEYPETLAELVPEYLKAMPLDSFSGEAFQYRPHGFDLPLLRYHYLPANTPLFWSIGSKNIKPQETTKQVYHDEQEPETVHIVEFISTEQDVHYPQSFIFPLPK